MINIAIIDDGVSDQCFYIDNIVKHIVIDKNNNVIRNSANMADKYSHGSICAAILSKNIKELNIISISLPYSELVEGIQIDALITALKLCLSLEINILHLSLGITDYSYYFDLLKIINELNQKGILIIGACNILEKITMPACFSNVIGVMYSPYVKNKPPFRFLDNSICGADVLVNIKEVVTQKDGINTCFEKQSSYAVPYVCSEIAKLLSHTKTLKEIKNKYNIKFEKNIDWIDTPLILIFSNENINLLKNLIVFDNYEIMNLLFSDPEKNKFKELANKVQNSIDIIIIGCQTENINRLEIKNEIKELLNEKNVAVCIDDNTFTEFILERVKGRVYSLVEMSKKTLIQNKPNQDITILWKSYHDEAEIEDILTENNNMLFVSCETIHILYGLEYIPKAIQNSVPTLYKYVSNLAYAYNLDSVCIIKKERL